MEFPSSLASLSSSRVVAADIAVSECLSDDWLSTAAGERCCVHPSISSIFAFPLTAVSALADVDSSCAETEDEDALRPL